MFPEFSEQIARLKTSDPRFSQLFDRHHELDERIRNLEAHVQLGTHEEIETLKKEKLLVKDQLYAMLRKAGAAKP